MSRPPVLSLCLVLGTAITLCLAGCHSETNATRSATALKPRQITRLQAADSLIVAESLYYRGEYDSVKGLLRPLVVVTRRKEDSITQARALTWLGLTAWRQGDYAEARRAGERALDLKLSLKLKADLSRSYNALGLLAHSQSRYADAISLFGRAAFAAGEAGDSAGIAKALGNRGLSYVEIGEFDKAREGFEAHRAFAERSGDGRAEANALSNLAMLDIRLGAPQPAIAALSKARSLYKSADNPVGEENVLGQLGTAYDELGDSHRSMAHLDSALEVARGHGLAQQESEDLQLLAAIFGNVGDHSRALEYLAQARRISEGLAQIGELGDIAATEAAELREIGRLDVAIARATEARELHHRSRATIELMRDNLLVAEIAQRLGNTKRAETAIREATRASRVIDVPVARAELALGKAQLADLRGDPGGVLRSLADVAQDMQRLGPAGEWEMHALQSRAYSRSGRAQEAAAAGRLAVAKLEEVRGRISSGTLRTTFSSERADVYAELVVALLRIGRVSEAFSVADAARGRALLEHIGAARSELQRSSGRSVADAEGLLRRIDWLVERLRAADTIPRKERGGAELANVSALETQLAAARREYESLTERFQSSDPRASALLAGTRPKLHDVQHALSADEALIQFFLASDRLVTFVVTRDTVEVVQTPVSSDDVSSRVRLAIDAARHPPADDSAAQPIFRKLHALLIGPAEKTRLLLGKHTLILVPHASLVHLPFAALVEPGGRYLVERYAILTLSSAAVLPAIRLSRPPAEGQRASVFAPFPRQLPGSLTEATVVRNSVNGTRAYLGAAATERVLRDELKYAARVHVASHAALDESTPMFSSVELVPSAGNNPADDGRLEVHEILGLSIRSSLVYLSGCETAAGVSWSTAFRRGQDYATLSQAFLYAGARNVIATLWRIDDESAPEFARHFYEQLRSSTPVASLADAQRAMIRDRRFSAPRYWAAYTISGAGNEAHAADGQLAAAATTVIHALTTGASK